MKLGAQDRGYFRPCDRAQGATRSIDRTVFRPTFGSMEILTVSQAKPRMGRLIDRALDGESVVIRKGNRLVQLIEYVVPEPIPERPIGYFRRRAENYEQANHAAVDLTPVR